VAAGVLSIPCWHALIPWCQVKSRRGKKKTIRTQNYFCSNEACAYYLITDQDIHALVGDGKHGKVEDIQDLLCQACGKKFTCRKHSVLYCLKTHAKVVSLSLKLLSLGMDPSALEEALEIRESTLRTWLARSGAHGRKLHQRFFTVLDLVHLQLDELWADVKQARQDIWFWTVCDAKTKLIPGRSDWTTHAGDGVCRGARTQVQTEARLCPSLQLGWTEALFLRTDSPFWGVGEWGRREQAELDGVG
jgi:hypothetical protein